MDPLHVLLFGARDCQVLDGLLFGRLLQDKERPGRAEDVVRLYDALVAFAADLGDLAADLGGSAGEYLIDEAAAQVPSYPSSPPTPHTSIASIS